MIVNLYDILVECLQVTLYFLTLCVLDCLNFACFIMVFMLYLISCVY